MKKIYSFFSFAMLALVMLAFSACNNGNENEEGTKVNVGNATYMYGDQNMYGMGENFIMHMPFEGVKVTADAQAQIQYEGSGDVLVVEILSTSADNIFPATGEYKVGEAAEDANIVIAGFEYDLGEMLGLPAGQIVVQFGSYLAHVTNGKIDTYKFITDGSMTLEGNSDKAKFVLKAVFDNDSTATYSYEGALQFNDPSAPDMSLLDPDPSTVSFDYEPTEASTFDESKVTFSEYGCVNYGDFFRTGSDCMQLDLTGDEWEASILFWGKTGSKAPQGVYKVEKSKAAGTVWPSPGGNDEEDFRSLFVLWDTKGTADTGDDTCMGCYYIADGTLTIEGKTIKGDFITAHGSALKFNYTDAQDITFNAQQQVKATKNVRKFAAPKIQPINHAQRR